MINYVWRKFRFYIIDTVKHFCFYGWHCKRNYCWDYGYMFDLWSIDFRRRYKYFTSDKSPVDWSRDQKALRALRTCSDICYRLSRGWDAGELVDVEQVKDKDGLFKDLYFSKVFKYDIERERQAEQYALEYLFILIKKYHRRWWD